MLANVIQNLRQGIAEKQEINKSGQQLTTHSLSNVVDNLTQILNLMFIPGDENPYKSCKTLAAFLLTLTPSAQLPIGIFVS